MKPLKQFQLMLRFYTSLKRGVNEISPSRHCLVSHCAV
jgi:hypothetical protein